MGSRECGQLVPVWNKFRLDGNSVCANFAHTAKDGKVYQVHFYNLDVILAVGYRTNSKTAIAFCQLSEVG